MPPSLGTRVLQGEKAHRGRDWRRGGSSFDLLPKRERGETHLSPDKLFAYQLTLVKEKIFPEPSVPRLGLVWGPGLPAAQGARPSFRIRDSCPLDYFGKRLNSAAPRPSFEAFPVTLKLFAHPAPDCQLLLRPARPVLPFSHCHLPASYFPRNLCRSWTPPGWRGWGARAEDSRLNRGKGSLSHSLVSSVTAKHQPGPPGVHPVQPSPNIISSRNVPLVKAKLLGKGDGASQAGVAASERPRKPSCKQMGRVGVEQEETTKQACWCQIGVREEKGTESSWGVTIFSPLPREGESLDLRRQRGREEGVSLRGKWRARLGSQGRGEKEGLHEPWVCGREGQEAEDGVPGGRTGEERALTWTRGIGWAPQGKQCPGQLETWVCSGRGMVGVGGWGGGGVIVYGGPSSSLAKRKELWGWVVGMVAQQRGGT